MRVLRARLLRARARRAAGEDRLRAQGPGRQWRALREGPHLQLPPGPRHRPPDQAHLAQPRRRSRRRAGRVHRGAGGGGEAAAARGRRLRGLSSGRVGERQRARGARRRGRRAGRRRGRDPAARRRTAARRGDGVGPRPSCRQPRGRRFRPARRRRFGEMVRRRLRREPVAYILGRKGFRHIELAVDRRVLIPRPETELLVELAVELRPRTVLDVGTGSGRDRAGGRRRAARVRGDRDRHLARGARGGAGQRRAARPRRAGALRSRGRVPGRRRASS